MARNIVIRQYDPARSGVGQQDPRGPQIYNALPPGIAEFKNYDLASDYIIQLAAGVGQLVLRANSKRRMLIVQNLDAANPAFVRFGQVAVVGQGLQLAAGGNVLLDVVCPRNDVYAISAFALTLYVNETVFTQDV